MAAAAQSTCYFQPPGEGGQVMAVPGTPSRPFPMLLSAGELAQQLAEVVVVDCRFDLMNPDAGRAAYDRGHVPGAWYAHLDRDLAGPRTPESGRHPLPDADALRALFTRFGITRASRVVAYDDGHGAIAARLWWLLRWMGHEAVALLDGGFAAWQRAGLPVSTDPPANASGEVFQGEPGHMPVRDAGQVEAALDRGSIRLIDVRAEDRFLGRSEPIDPRAGHVPGALNLPFAGNLAEGQLFAEREELERRYAPLVEGHAPGDIVFMCGSGVTACHGIFALERAGVAGAALYPGSWSEWIRSPSRPVARE